MSMLMRCILLFMLALAAPSASFAVQPDEILPDAGQELRARQISAGLRCLVCQNQSIDDSDAPLAKDLRMIVRERITAGDTDKGVLDYVVARYGNYVLLKPPLNMSTLLLWMSPLLLLIAGLWLGRRVMIGAAPDAPMPADQPLSTGERAKLQRMLGDENAKS